MTQYGWCFVVDVKNDKRRGWVPGSSRGGGEDLGASCVFWSKNCHGRHFSVEEYGLPSKLAPYVPSNAGWPAGNYITCNGRDPYQRTGGQVEETLWREVQSGTANRLVEEQDAAAESTRHEIAGNSFATVHDNADDPTAIRE